MVHAADLGELGRRLVPRVLRVRTVGDSLPRPVPVRGVEAAFVDGDAGDTGAVGGLLAGADIGVIAPGGIDALILGTVQRPCVGRLGVRGRVEVQTRQHFEVLGCQVGGAVMEKIDKVVLGLGGVRDVRCSLVGGSRRDGRHLEKRSVDAGLGAGLLKERAAMNRLEGPGDGRVVLVEDGHRGVADVVDVGGAQALQCSFVALSDGRVAAEQLHILVKLSLVERVVGGRERARSDGPRLVNRTSEEGLAGELSVVAKVLDARRVGAGAASSQSDGRGIAAEGLEMFLQELEEESLIQDAEVKQALLLKQRRRQESERPNAVVEGDGDDGLGGVGYKRRSVKEFAVASNEGAATVDTVSPDVMARA